MSEEKIPTNKDLLCSKIYLSADKENFEELFLTGTVHFVSLPMMYETPLPKLSLKQKINLLSPNLAKFKLDFSQPAHFFVAPRDGAVYMKETRLFSVYKGNYIVLSENKISIMSGDTFRDLYNLVTPSQALAKAEQNIPGAGQRSL